MFTWDPLCSGTYDEKIDWFKADDTLLGTLPAGISIDASFTITYLTTKEMTLDANYHSDFYAEYSIKNRKAETPGLVDTQI